MTTEKKAVKKKETKAEAKPATKKVATKAPAKAEAKAEAKAAPKAAVENKAEPKAEKVKAKPVKTASSKAVFAKGMAIKGSVQKVNLVANMIKGMKAFDALTQLKFCRKKAANDLYTVLNSAIANAENNHNRDIDNLYIDRIVVGKSFVLKRFHARGRGRASGIKKPFSNVTIYLDEKR
jgi:large subunit ribosomal protein L22